MSQFKINSITDKSGTSGPVIAGVSTNNSTGCMIIPAGPTEHRGGRGRGLFAGGNPNTNVIQFITISSAGNAEDFGDLSYSAEAAGGGASPTRAIFAGGTDSGGKNIIDYWQIMTLGNAQDFGDRTIAMYGCGVASNGHGGLG